MKRRHHPLFEIIELQKSGIFTGVCSICSANKYVIRAGFEHSQAHNTLLVIESTSNQVNQFGGYTGMTPEKFREYVYELAAELNFPQEALVLGGDHLGPNPWKNKPAAEAMEKAFFLVKQYVLAGFTKIHLDPSMLLGDDIPGMKGELNPKVVAERSAILCHAAEEGYKELLIKEPSAIAPVYIIGTEVPIPGGTQGDDDGLSVTKPADFNETIRLTKGAFIERGLDQAWSRVVGVVVQPGVEFGDHTIDEYDRELAKELTRELTEYPNLVFEGHSTDYQTPQALRELVEDGVAILKVGPELTFTFREAIFLLEHIEQELPHLKDVELSNIQNVMEKVMLAEPDNWAPYYRGDEQSLEFSRKYSHSDRIRYYWPNTNVAGALKRLLSNLSGVEIPLPLLSQYFPKQYAKIRTGELANDVDALIKDRIAEVYEKYRFATQPVK